MKKTIISLIIGASLFTSAQVIAMKEDLDDLFTKKTSYVVPVKTIISFLKSSSVFPDSKDEFHKQHVFTIGNNAFMISNVGGEDNFLDKIPSETPLTFTWKKNVHGKETYGPGFQSNDLFIYENGQFTTTEDCNKTFANYIYNRPTFATMKVADTTNRSFFSSELLKTKSALNCFTIRPYTPEDK
jgi:hypothetical protein